MEIVVSCPLFSTVQGCLNADRAEGVGSIDHVDHVLCLAEFMRLASAWSTKWSAWVARWAEVPDFALAVVPGPSSDWHAKPAPWLSLQPSLRSIHSAIVAQRARMDWPAARPFAAETSRWSEIAIALHCSQTEYCYGICFILLLYIIALLHIVLSAGGRGTTLGTIIQIQCQIALKQNHHISNFSGGTYELSIYDTMINIK